MATITITKYNNDGSFYTLIVHKKEGRPRKITIQPHSSSIMMRKFGLSPIRKNWRYLKEKYGGLG